MGQGRLAGAGRVAAADQPGRADRVMGSAEGSASRRRALQPPAGAGDPRHLERLLGRQRRQDRGQAAGGERLAGPRRADHQQAVPAGRGDLERVAQVALAAQVGEVGAVAVGVEQRAAAARGAPASTPRPPERAAARGSRAAITSMPSASAASGPFSAGTTIASAPSSRAASAIASAPETGRTEPSSASSPTIASRGSASQLELARGDQQRGRDRQVHPRPRLAQAGRRQVGDDPPQRELEAAVGHRRPHPLARLPHRGVGQADDREGREAAVDVDLDPDRAGGDAVEGEGSGGGEHGSHARRPRFARGARIVRNSSPSSVVRDSRAMRARRRPSLAAMTETRQRIGRAAEDLVAARLAAAGWEIVERNARTRYGELDIVALDGRDARLRRGQGRARGLDLRPGAPGPRRRPQKAAAHPPPRHRLDGGAARRSPLRRDPLRRGRRHLRPRRRRRRRRAHQGRLLAGQAPAGE